MKTNFDCADGVPMPIVKLNRVVIVTSIVLAVLLQLPLVTTALFLVLLAAVVIGPRGSLIFRLGDKLFARQNATAEREDRRLMRFNNSIAVLMLGLAQLAFWFGYVWVGWGLALAVAVAATVALLGFCVGCFLYYQFKLQRYKLFG